ncbi:conserved hypothetical protein [Bradyrhizobium sp. STM 3843]|nr:DUF1127 domain-containing protein [Bradyrhizobium sp. STM 3843]CCE09238.1 conserved hypothetical protein [Bradyrhizobium sp. STM 3843]
MPPHQTNLTPETGRDAARLGLSVALLKVATDDALRAVRPDASIAALRDALSEKDAAGPPAVSAPGILSLFKRCWRALQERRQRQSLRASLYDLCDLSDRELMDIGLTRAEIDFIAPHRAIDRLRDRMTYPWLSRGVM